MANVLLLFLNSLLGQNQHIGLKEDLRLNLDDFDPDSRHNYVSIQTPPRVLTLEDRPFPVVTDEDQMNKHSSVQFADPFADPANGLVLHRNAR